MIQEAFYSQNVPEGIPQEHVQQKGKTDARSRKVEYGESCGAKSWVKGINNPNKY